MISRTKLIVKAILLMFFIGLVVWLQFQPSVDPNLSDFFLLAAIILFFTVLFHDE